MQTTASTVTPIHIIESEAIYWLESFNPDLTIDCLIADGKFHQITDGKLKSKLGAPCYSAQNYDDKGIFVCYSSFANHGTQETWNSFDYYNSKRTGSVSDYDLKKIEERDKFQRKNREELIANAIRKEVEHERERSFKLFSKTNEYIDADEIKPETVVGGYFRTKEVADILHLVNGARIDQKMNVVVPLTDIDGNAQGYQFINTDAKIIYGKSKGNFVIIGDTSAKRFYVCEGIATGLSIYKGLKSKAGLKKVCVICALNAYNLSPVQTELRKNPKFKNKYFIFCCDNDSFDKNFNLKFLIQDNAGVYYSNKAAMLSSKNFVCLPKTIDGKSTDFNDILVANGVEAVAKDLAQISKPNPSIVFAKEIFNRNRDLNKYDDYGKRYLEDLDIKKGFNLVKSPIGTGKTTALIPHAKNAHSFLYISHLISLTTDASQKLGIDNYLENGDIIHLFPKMGICLNSIYKLMGPKGCPNYQYVVIDEIEQMLERLTTNIANKKLVITALTYIIKNAEFVVMLDADLGKLTKKFIKDLGSEKEIHCTYNNYQPKKQQCVIHENDGTIKEQALDALRHGKKVFITSNSKKEIKKINTFFIKEGFKGLSIHSENTGNEEAIKFFKDPNNQVKRHQYLIVSPSVSTGVSIDSVNGNQVFDYVAGIFRAGINSPNDAMQALGRVRDVKEVNVFAQRNGIREITNEQDELKNIIDLALRVKNKSVDAELIITDDGKLDFENHLYSNLCARVRVKRKKGQCDFFGNIIYKFAMRGAVFSWVIKSKTSADTNKQIIQDELVDHIEAIINSADLNEAERNKISKKNRPTQEDSNALEKSNLKKFYGEEVPLDYLIEEDDRGKLRTSLKKLLIVTKSQTEINRLDKEQAENQIMDADLKDLKVENQIALAVTSTVGVNIDLTDMGFIYSRESQYIKDLINMFDKKRSQWQSVVSIPKLEVMINNPIRFLSTQLKRLGLKQERTNRNSKGEYIICAERLALARMAMAGHSDFI